MATDLRMSAFGSVPRLPAPTKRLGRAFDRRGPTGELGARHSRRERRAIPPGDPLEDPRFSGWRGGDENPQRPLCRQSAGADTRRRALGPSRMSHARDTRSARAATGGSGAKPGTSSFASPGRDAASSFGPYAGIRRVGGDHAAAAGSHGGAKADAQRQREFRFSFDEARGVSGAYPARTKGRATTAGPSRSTATHVRPTAIPRGAPDVDSPSRSPFPVNGSKPSVFSDSRLEPRPPRRPSSRSSPRA